MLRELFRHTFLEWRDRIYQKISGKLIEKPWMKYREIKIIEDIIKNLKPQKCLEWGTGFSTIYFSQLLKTSSIWISIEHNRKWYFYIKNKISEKKLNNVQLFFIAPNKFPWSDKYGDGDYFDLIDYIEFPSKFGKFDFILIDGRARKYCLIKAYELVEDSGIVILHDANRIYYHEPFKLFKNQFLFKDYRKQSGGLWVGSKKLNIQSLIPHFHFKFWQVVNKFGRVLQL